MRTNVKSLSLEKLAEVMPEELAEQVKEAAEISMGTEILDEDERHIKTLAKSVVEISDYRANLAEYLKNRMGAVAPNLTMLIGELVAAKLIAHSGSLMNLAKQPASTIQILGAEKALFRALKTKKNTPKYGLIYNASVVGKAKTNLKGKVSRTLANKCALCVRFGALGENQDGMRRVERRRRIQQGGAKMAGTGRGSDRSTATRCLVRLSLRREGNTGGEGGRRGAAVVDEVLVRRRVRARAVRTAATAANVDAVGSMPCGGGLDGVRRIGVRRARDTEDCDTCCSAVPIDRISLLEWYARCWVGAVVWRGAEGCRG